MFTGRSVKNIRQLIDECKKYVELQKEYVKLELIEKLTVLFSTLILIMLIIVLGVVILFYLSLSLAYLLEPHVGGLTNSYLIISGIILLFIFVIYAFRYKLIVNPILNFIANIFHNDSKNKQ